VDKSQSEKQLFELHGSWGYKEYLTALDLLELKEKYLTQNHTSLNLNCKIVLFYTLTAKNNLNSLTETQTLPPIMLNTGEKCEVRSFNLSNLNTRDSSNELTNGMPKLCPLKECNTLLYDLKRLFNQSDMYDLIIKAPVRLDVEIPGEDSYLNNQQFKQFKVHKLILSVRSEVFEKMFSKNNMSDAYMPINELDGNVLNIVDFDAFIVEAFLNYLYTDVLEINVKKFQFNFNYKYLDILKLTDDITYDNASLNGVQDNDDLEENDDNKSIVWELYTHLFIELYKISDKYCVYRLKSICEKQLLKLVTIETCVELLILSFLHNSTKLKQECLDYLSKNISSIITQANWIHLEKHYPSLLAEAFRFLYLRQGSQN
jgi:hypothetical protein